MPIGHVGTVAQKNNNKIIKSLFMLLDFTQSGLKMLVFFFLPSPLVCVCITACAERACCMPHGLTSVCATQLDASSTPVGAPSSDGC